MNIKYINRHTCSQTYVMSRYANRFVMLSYVMLCSVLLCYVMYVCMCSVYIYIVYIHTLIHIYTYMCVYIYIHIHIHMGIFSLLGIICSDDVVSFAGLEIWEAM